MSDSLTVSLSLFEAAVRACPLCGSTSFEPLARHDRNLLGICTVGCRTCGFLQTNPRPSAKGLDRFYRDYYRLYYQGTASPDQNYIANLNKDARLAYTAKFFAADLRLRADAVVLDYGCGEGSLFAALRKAGFSGAFYGVELNANFGEFASRYGNATVSNSIRANEPVDLAIMNHVLEHLDDPVGTLKELARLVKPDGQLYIDVPDAEEYDKIYDLHIAHIFHFTERTLRSVVEAAGFKVTRVEKHEPPFHPKSVRLVATPSAAAERGLAAKTSAANEQRAWSAVRRCGRFRHTIRLRLQRIALLRQAYQFMKRLTGHGTPA
jgi:SAM-dependent methyltransferase